MLEAINKKLEPIYKSFRSIDETLSKQPSEVRLITSVVSLIINILVPVVYLIAHKPKMATWLTGLIILQFFTWGVWILGPAPIAIIASLLIKIFSIAWLAFWLHALYLFITVIVPEWKSARDDEAKAEEERTRFNGVRIKKDDDKN